VRFLVEDTEFALESVWSLCIEWQGLKMGSEVVVVARVFGSEPALFEVSQR